MQGHAIKSQWSQLAKYPWNGQKWSQILSKWSQWSPLKYLMVANGLIFFKWSHVRGPNPNSINNSSSSSYTSTNSVSDSKRGRPRVKSTHITELDNIKHNVDIGVKISTKKCGDRGCPLHVKLKCTKSDQT